MKRNEFLCARLRIYNNLHSDYFCEKLFQFLGLSDKTEKKFPQDIFIQFLLFTVKPIN